VLNGMTNLIPRSSAEKLDLQALVDGARPSGQRLLAAWCWKHADGVSLIARRAIRMRMPLATEPAMLRLLDVACSTFRIVLVDMPRGAQKLRPGQNPFSAQLMRPLSSAS